MSYMKRHLEGCMDHATAGNWAQLLAELSPWRDQAPEQLWAVIEYLAALEEDTAGNWYHTQRITPERGLALYDTKALAEMFSQLSKDGYSALGLGLIVDLVEQQTESEK